MKVKEKSLTWLFCGILFMLGFEAGGFQWALTRLAAEYGLTAASSGLLVSEQYAVMIAAPLISGVLADRVGEKKMTLIGMGAFFAGCIVIGTGNFASALLGNLLAGFGYSATECIVTTILAKLPGAERNVNDSQCAFCVGAVLSPPLLKGLPREWGWRGAFLIPGAAFFLLFYPMAGLKLPHLEEKRREKAGKRRLSNVRILLVLTALMGGYGMIENGSGYYLEGLFSEHLGSGLGAAALSAFWVAMAFGRFLAGRRKPVSGDGKVRCADVGLAFLAVFFVLGILGFWKWGPAALAAAFFLGFFCAPLWPGLMLEAAKAYPQGTGTVIGIMNIAGAVGGAGSPAILGYVKGKATPAAPFRVLQIVAALAAAGCVFLAGPKENRKRRTDKR